MAIGFGVCQRIIIVVIIELINNSWFCRVPPWTGTAAAATAAAWTRAVSAMGRRCWWMWKIAAVFLARSMPPATAAPAALWMSAAFAMAMPPPVRSTALQTCRSAALTLLLLATEHQERGQGPRGTRAVLGRECGVCRGIASSCTPRSFCRRRAGLSCLKHDIHGAVSSSVSHRSRVHVSLFVSEKQGG